ncbi:MAG TPA: DUF5317 family protein [Mycobacteriales bacterium]|nr:DUF5317 family protein [Mycobacteriales bacterium]
MGLILLVVACAALVARLCGGRLARLDSGPVRGWRLLAASLVVVGLAAAVDAVNGPGRAFGPVNAFALVVGGVLVAVFCVANRSVPGVGLVGLGLLLNALVVGVNGAMPVSRHALLRAGTAMPAAGPVRHVGADQQTSLGRLGDVVPVPLPGHREVDSAGDLLVAAGAAQFVLAGMLGQANRPDPRPDPGGDPGRSRTRPPATGTERRRRDSTRTRYRGRGATVGADAELVRVIVQPPTGEMPDPD